MGSFWGTPSGVGTLGWTPRSPGLRLFLVWLRSRMDTGSHPARVGTSDPGPLARSFWTYLGSSQLLFHLLITGLSLYLVHPSDGVDLELRGVLRMGTENSSFWTTLFW